MDGWVDGRMDGWVDGWMDGWTDGWVDGWYDAAASRAPPTPEVWLQKENEHERNMREN